MIGVKVDGRGRARRRLPEEAVEKQNTPSSCMCVTAFPEMSRQPIKCDKLKTGSTVIRQKKHMQSRWMKRWNSYFFRQKRIGFDNTSSAVTNMSWYLLHSIFSKRKSLSIATVNLFDSLSFFLPFGRKRYFEATKNCTRRFTRNNIFSTSWYLPHSISSKWQSVSVATVNSMLIPFDHKQSVEADKRQLRPKVCRHNSFHKNQHLKYQAFPKASCIW